MENVQEKALAGTLLTEAAGSASKTLDAFGSWLLVTFGGALAVLIANLDVVDGYVPVADVRCAAQLFIWAAFPAVLQKYISAAVVAGKESSAVGRKEGADLAERDVELDIATFVSELLRVAPPARWFVGRSVRKILAGDFATGGRMLHAMAQVQAFLVLVETVLILLAMWTLVYPLG